MLKFKTIFTYTDTFISVFQEIGMLISPDCLVFGLVDWHLICPFLSFSGRWTTCGGKPEGVGSEQYYVSSSLSAAGVGQKEIAVALQSTTSHWCQVGLAVQHRVVEVIFLRGKAETLRYTLGSKSLTRKNKIKWMCYLNTLLLKLKCGVLREFQGTKCRLIHNKKQFLRHNSDYFHTASISMQFGQGSSPA